ADPYNGPSSTITRSATSNLTFVQNASTLWTFTYGLIYSDYHRDPFNATFDETMLGLPQYMQDTATLHVFPMFSAGGYSDMGTQGYWKMDRQEGVHQFSGSMTKIVRGHSIKAGGEFRQNFLDYAQPGYPSGKFSFGAQTTSEDLNTGNAYQGNGFASMLIGWGNGSNFHIDPKAFSRAAYRGFFVQDDWKMSRKLTVNLGLRYEYEVPRTELQDRYSYWDLNAPSPISVPGYDLKGAVKFVDDQTPSPFDVNHNNFGPRLGFAYALDDKTSIRAGAGRFFLLSRATVSGHTGAAFNTDAAVPWSLDSGATRNATLSNPYPQGILTPPGRSLGDMTLIGLGVGTITRQTRNPEMYSWNLSVQRDIGWSSMVEINYTGSRGVHLYSPYTSLSPLDPVYWLGPNALYTRAQLQAAVPNPFYNIITDPKAVNLNGRTIQRYRLLRNMPQYDGVSGSDPNAASSSYHGVQFKYDKRFSGGLTVLTHYTWSRMIDDASVTDGNLTWLGGTTSFQNPLDLSAERSLSQHDVEHRFVATGDWQMPFGHGRRFGSGMSRLADALIGGWEVSAFFLLQSGFPLQVNQSGGTLWNGTQRPNLVGDPATAGDIHDRLNNYFNQDAFSRPAPDTFGTAPRTLDIRGPAVNILDAALIKNWRVQGGQRFEFRIEAQNLRNRPVFSDPATNATSYGASNFGVINGTKVGPRNVQLGFKYYF
ncbi:MAG TPA: TonB-dependent receptor, partial [Vicinamibacterales bacterium]|nr:TonB-dependent receptor [Vicinamibacterales bacterium]